MDTCCYIVGKADPGHQHTVNSSFYFSRGELTDAINKEDILNIQVWLEHGDQTRENIGRVVYSWLARDGLYVIIRLDLDNIRSRAILTWIKNGLLSGLSLGYSARYDKNYTVQSKKIYEISVVKTPFHPECRIDGVFTDDDLVGMSSVFDSIENDTAEQLKYENLFFLNK